MPRWASRITLEITGIKVERLQDITDADAIAEGVGPFANIQTIDCETESPRRTFKGLWESINGTGSWDSNPWLWVISFRRIHQNDCARAAPNQDTAEPTPAEEAAQSATPA
jgi:hypothetical protein